ncbi:MAG: HlyD family efflux transporter periplasmic adaptor subunit [Planctomycetes bacterium]|nr:HlyD family efflux transporter periplasmic adaptor subunit [Planctomycetota bacterium]
MIRKYVLPFVALAGVVLAIWTVIMGARPVPAGTPVSEPSRAPFASYMAGAGIVEASSENIEAATPVPGLVVEVLVEVGKPVKAGAPLLRLDGRDLAAEIEVRKTIVKSARLKLARTMSFPRPEDVPPLEARVKAFEADAENAKDQLKRVEAMPDKRAMSEEDLSRRRFAALTAEARAAEARATLALLKAGAWAPDIALAESEIAGAEAQLHASEVALERLTVRSPIDAEILQVNIRPGEYALAASPLVVLGNTEVLHVRVDIDENDAWRFKAGAAAIAYVRGNRDLNTKLEFVRVEPFVVPKRSLTGSSQERVDTRVMQVLFRFSKSELPVYVGQQMDVSIEAPPVAARK